MELESLLESLLLLPFEEEPLAGFSVCFLVGAMVPRCEGEGLELNRLVVVIV